MARRMHPIIRRLADPITIRLKRGALFLKKMLKPRDDRMIMENVTKRFRADGYFI